MSMTQHLPASGPTGAHDGAPIIVPSAEVRAIVRFGERPTVAPEHLAAFVVCEQGDWVLTADALAFGDPGILERFDEWRATWERTWLLDPRTNVVRLLELGRATSDPVSEFTTLLRLSSETDGSDDLLIPRDLVSRSRAEVRRLADVARGRDALGHGLVDLTPHSHRTGLARSWPACGGPEVVAAMSGTRVVLAPGQGLFLELTGRTTLGAIDLAVSDADGWTVHAGVETVQLDHDVARPLGWLVPGATAWRHRRVPEVVTWTRTLVGLDECFVFAEEAGLDVRLTTRRPVQST